MRVPQQMFGRQGNGCGATIGAMPRCDFACRGCYLNDEANRVPAEPVDAIKAQMRLLRPVLGHAGNIQITDGEVTLRPVEEVVELLRYARSLDLIPMLMTHGDSFRRRSGLLERLMVEGGLTEVSIHIDTTQRWAPGRAVAARADGSGTQPAPRGIRRHDSRGRARDGAHRTRGDDDDRDTREPRRRPGRGPVGGRERGRVPPRQLPTDRAGRAHRERLRRRGRCRGGVGSCGRGVGGSRAARRGWRNSGCGSATAPAIGW